MRRARPECRTRHPSFAPLYLQIKALLSKSLEAGEWRPGEAIPSEIELARRYRVSQGTVRKAIDALASDNLVVRRQGKGTFVATHTEERTSLFASCGYGATTAPPCRR
jgi:GntR family transcriptional regulator